MRNNLSVHKIDDDSVVIDYIDDYLYDRLKHDETKSSSDWIDGAIHLAIKNKNRTVGIISFLINDDYAMIHPKIKKEHMIYAKRACLISFDYLRSIKLNTVFAKFPEKFKSNIRMADACGMQYIDTINNDVSINGKFFDSLIYGKAL